jgi:hypothetical protein
MRKVSLFFTFVLFLCGVFAQDLPAPGANLQTLPTGSYVIAMDNANQTNQAGNFNLRAYGLIVHLLNNNVRVRWVITAGKMKDANDITVNARRVKPVAGTNAAFDFKAGPFVIFPQDLTNVDALIDGFYSANTLTNNDRPSVYVTNASASVDIRYDLIGFKPKAAILTDGGNQAIHTAYFTAARVPTMNYALSTGNDLFSKCFTFASEPHNDKTGAAIDATINGINSFVRIGGNFLAQCEAVQTYENRLVALNAADGNPSTNGGFQTTTGVTDANSTAGSVIQYPNPDLSFNQFEGAFSISKGGSLQNWRVNSGRTNNTHAHAHATGDTTVMGASVSKNRLFGSGGLVFYIGNHRFDDALTTLTAINGIRMYLNAFLTPVTINATCATGAPLPVTFKQFHAQRNRNQAELEWTTSFEANNLGFEVQRKTGEFDYVTVGFVYSKAPNGFSTSDVHYRFNDPAAGKGASFYRLRQVDRDGRAKFSDVRAIRGLDQSGQVLIFPNPSANGQVNISFESIHETRMVRISDATGRVVRQWNNVQDNLLQVEALVPGMYQVRVANKTTGVVSTQRVVVNKR